ncbi:MAG TPA: HAD-IA family hydrolase [Anaerolineaceae bacterium]|nr:HAD-IA family hydrolase [Anaerolineaceae bacterium]
MLIKAVLFDVGGTLETFRYTRELRIANTPVMRSCLERAGIRLDLSDEALADLITSGIGAYHHWDLKSMIEIPTADIWSNYVFKDTPVDKDALAGISEELSFLYETNYYIREMRPEIPEVLQRLKKQGFRLGCISNTQSVTQVPATLTRYGIRDYFETIVLSSRYGRRKPDPSIFYQAAQQIGLPTSACVYVGDKINRDILGARRAGYKLAVKIRHAYDDGEKDEGAVPDLVIDDMRELVPFLEVKQSEARSNPDPLQQRKIKALFFDAGDILYYRPSKSPNFTQFLAEQHLAPVADFEDRRIALKDLAYQGRMPRHKYFEELTRLYGIHDQDLVAQGAAALICDENIVGVFEGVPQTILALKERGYILGIITDTAMPFSKKLKWFEEHGFGYVWDAVISSKEVGVRKPDPEMYRKALVQTGIEPGQALFVGHKEAELAGARALGMKTVAFNYEPDARADAYLDKFEDLLSNPLLAE